MDKSLPAGVAAAAVVVVAAAVVLVAVVVVVIAPAKCLKIETKLPSKRHQNRQSFLQNVLKIIQKILFLKVFQEVLI